MTAGGTLLVLGPRERVVVRGGRGLGRAAAGVLVRGLEAAEFEVEAGVEGGGERGQRAERQVLAAAEDLADPPGRDTHPRRELSPGQATLAHMEGDLVGQLRDQPVHLLVNFGLDGLVVWFLLVTSTSEDHPCLHLLLPDPVAPGSRSLQCT